MSENTAKYLDTFPTWLRSLGTDAEGFASLLAEEALAPTARESVAGGLNYLFKSLDLIPDGIDDIGFLDDAFVLRVAADLASREDISNVPDELQKILSDLAADCEMIRAFLEDDYGRLETYVQGLRKGASRGRAVSDIVADPEVMQELISDVRGFAGSYESPSFAREEKNLIKLKAFFQAKLPR